MEQIKQGVIPIADKYKIKSLYLFGSYANGSATEKSDIDFLVKFGKERPSIFDVAGLQYELQRALTVPVDVLTLPLVNPKRIQIERSVQIYGE